MKKSTNSIKKRLLISALVPLALIGINSNSANAEDIYAPVPTLTKLHDAGETIPDTNPPVVYPESAYSFVNNTSYDINIKPQGTGDSNVYYKWSTDENNNRQLTNGTVVDYDFIAKYDSSNMQSRLIHGNGEDVLGDFYGFNNTDGSISRGGAIIVPNSNSLGSIVSNFINNSISSFPGDEYGGAIYNSGTINSIKGNFINNSVTNTGTVEGGAIYNTGAVGTIEGNFINNYASGNGARGGAIRIIGHTISSVTGDFINNYTLATQHAFGGAIYNQSGKWGPVGISNITGDFINNYARSEYSAYGGAICNYSSNLGTIKGNFINNYAITTNTSVSSSRARGGAIYNGTFTTNLAGNTIPMYDSAAQITLQGNIFTGNYVNNNGIKTPNSISNFGTIFIADNATVTIYDGYSSANLGELRMGNNSTLNMFIANEVLQDDSLGKLTKNGTINATFDIDLVNRKSDTISTSGVTLSDNSGIITINGLNFINGTSGIDSDTKIQLLKTQTGGLQLTIAENLLNEKYKLGTISHTLEDTISASAKWNDKFQTYTQTGTSYGTVNTATTTTINDSIELKVTDTEWGEKIPTGSLGDTLALVNQLDTNEDRSFTFDTANDKYNASSDLGKTTAGKLSINGVSETTPLSSSLPEGARGQVNRSEINLNGHNGFELDNETTLNVNNTRLTGNNTLITVNNQNAVVNLKNADLNGSIAAENSYKLNITGDTSDRTIINGGVGKANATHSGGELGFNTDTFKDAEFSTLNGTVDLVTGQVENYDIGKLTSDESANWIFEVDSSGSGVDTLTVGTGSSGTVNVSEINFINGDSPSDEFTVQVLNAQDDNIQLAVNPSISSETHKLGTVTKTSQDTVTPTAKWNQTFNKYTQNGTNYGNIDVATTNTTNDSLQLKVTSTECDEKAVSGSMGDTLALVNQLETTENRNFNFDTANDVYNVTSDLGTSSAGTMNVNGVKSGETRSTINGNNYNMFALSNPTTLNLNNVKIQGANSVASGTNKNAVINMNNVELKNNASGITTAGSVNISGKSVFANNGNGIEVTDENSIITLNGLDGEGYDVTFKDKLKGVSGAKLNLKAGQVEFHKSVTDLDINMDGTTANLKADNVFNGQNLTVASASNVSMINNSVGTMQLNSLTLNDNMNLGVDVDLANKSMDRISANTYNLGDHKVNVNKMNLLSDAKEVRTDIEFADEQLRNNVTTSVSEVAYSPIYKYGVKYDQNNGEFQFTRSNSGGGGGGDKPQPQPQPSYNDLNPAVMASPVAAQLGGYAGMLDNYYNAFNHMDMYMLKPKNLRAAELNANKYAIADGRGGTYISNETNTNGIWVRPYTSYDSVGLKHGPKVHNLSYGSFIGGDFGMHDFGKGMYGTFSPYISYQGAHQHYSGNSVYQNGGTLGFTGTLYKGNFFTGLTAGVGANITDANTMYGNEDFPMLTSGVASKTGYNIEFKDGKFIIQPSLLVSYTFVNTFDYKNGAGVKIDTAPLHAVQISPNIRFSFNTKNHWQPYAFVGMNWNIMDSGHFRAADTTLPELSMKPYVHYGLGIQKLFSDNFTAFAQVAIRNGGRNGIGGTLGMKWLFGGQPQKQEEQKPKNEL